MLPTPHINAQAGDFSETVLLAGDPLRAQYIAKKWFSDAREVTNVRGMLGFTGQYQGQRLSVMGHGIGIPSASIYTTELVREYGVKNIIRVGSCGAIQPHIKLYDIIIAVGASTDSHANRLRFNQHDFAAIADFTLARTAAGIAEQRGMRIHIGNIFTTDFFYLPHPQTLDTIEKFGILAADMETAGIYSIAAEFGVRALTLCSVSDHLRTGEKLDVLARQVNLDSMIELGLETAYQMQATQS